MISDNKQLINANWLYKESKTSEGTRVHLPHTNKEVPYNYFDEKIYQFISYYERDLEVSADAKRVCLKFDGVMTAFKLFVNSQEVTECRGGYIPHTIEITDYVQKGQINKILVEVDSTEREDIPPFGFVIDYLTYGGIYRDVYLYELEPSFIEYVFYKYEVLELNEERAKVKVMPTAIINHQGTSADYNLQIELMGQRSTSNLTLQQGSKIYTLEAFELENVAVWDLDTPNLYQAVATLSQEEKVVDTATTSLGFRKLHIDETGVYLNEKQVKILGLNRHQAYPYVGYAMPKRVQAKDAEILKNELGLNTVRTSHYPQSPYFLDRCDELGLLVLEEIPGWQHVSKSEAWRKQALCDVEAMIKRDYNHPSIISWGVRINESLDDEELYTQTNKLARLLDDDRLTHGVRCFEKTQLLEDIYTMNDFIHTGGEEVLRSRQQVTGLDHEVPYLVSEFCGHMFPTKRFDQEERLVEHTLRHARIQSKARSERDYLGAIGWCSFDYNTHYDFGSGDRICYHGVMDMFRMPKFAAHFYQSQISPERKAVLEPLTYWSRGERDGGVVFPIYVCTNCDEVEVLFGEESEGRFGRTPEYTDPKLAGLEYPPIKIHLRDGDWGSQWTDITFVGYRNGQPVAHKSFSKNPMLHHLDVAIDDTTLHADELDATRITIKAVDECGNILPYAVGSLNIQTQGDIEVIGPNHIILLGGTAACWIRTKGSGNKGQATIQIQSSWQQNHQINVTLA